MAQLALITQIAGAGLALSQGAQAKSDANFAAEQLIAKGNEDAAIAQRRAERERERGERVLSRVRALAAKSGGGAKDPSILSIEDDINDDTTFNVLSRLYEGETQNNNAGAAAGQAQIRGRRAQSSGVLKAASIGGQSLYSKYS